MKWSCVMPEMGTLEANTAALNRLAAVLEKTGGVPTTSAKANGAEPVVEGKRGPGRPKKVSLNDVKAVAEELREAKGKPAAVALIKKHGADSLAEMEESQYAKFIAAAKTILNDDDEGDEGDEGDDSL